MTIASFPTPTASMPGGSCAATSPSGYGVHFCVGANLARIEGRIALEETLKRFPQWQVDRAGLVRQHTSTVRGYSAVPLQL